VYEGSRRRQLTVVAALLATAIVCITIDFRQPDGGPVDRLAAPGDRHLRPPPAGDQCGRAPGRRPGRHAGRAGRPPRGLRIAAVARDQFGALLAAGLLENVHMRRYL
jgi:hypothetical protein